MTKAELEQILNKHTINRFDQIDSQTFVNAMVEAYNKGIDDADNLGTFKSVEELLDEDGHYVRLIVANDLDKLRIY